MASALAFTTALLPQSDVCGMEVNLKSVFRASLFTAPGSVNLILVGVSTMVFNVNSLVGSVNLILVGGSTMVFNVNSLCQGV